MGEADNNGVMSFRRMLVILMVISVIFGVSVSAGAVSETVEVDAAVDDGTVTEMMQFTFEAPSNGTITSADEPSRGEVSFEFDESLPFEVTEGERYTVEYVAIVDQSASDGSHSETISLYYDDGSTATTEEFDLTVDELYPQIGSVTGDDLTREDAVVFEDSGTQTVTVDLSVPNNGDGVMIPEDVSMNTPSGISVEVDEMPSEIDANRQGAIELDMSVDSSVTEGTYTVSGTVQDNLETPGGDFSFDVEVRKPPVAGVSGDTVDVGNVLVGDDRTVEFSVEERGGFNGLNGLERTEINPDTSGSISFNIPRTFSTEPGGSDTAEVTVEVAEDAEQHDDVTFDVYLSGEHEDSPNTRTTFEARVIYPPILGNVDASTDTFRFNSPRTLVSSQQKQTTVEIENEGDLQMDVWSVDASVSDSQIDAEVIDTPNTVDGLSTSDSTIRLSADPDTPEGTYTMEVTVDTESAGSQTVEETFTIEHGTELNVDESDVGFGEVTITDRRTRSIGVSEALEYKDLENVQVEKVDGPDQWLTMTEEPPSTVAAGESAPIVYELEFDTEAEAYAEYTWTYEVSADNVETETVEVSAVARLLSPEEIISDLNDQTEAGSWQAPIASDTSNALQSMESRMRDGEQFTNGDIQRTLTIGQSTVVLIDSVETAGQLQSEGEYEAAQREVVSALVAQNTVKEYAEEMDNEQTAGTISSAVDRTDSPVDDVVSEQRTHYEAILERQDATALERYYASENLGEIARYRGNDHQADKYSATAEASFEEYQQLVDTGVQHRTEARDAHRMFVTNATVTILGQPFVLNPARIDEIQEHSNMVSNDIETAETAFRDAGATADANSVNEERASLEEELTILLYALYAATLLFSVLFVLLVAKEIMNARKYVQESHEASAGDFLL